MHGDYRLDNVLVHRERDSLPAQVTAVLDWEMSTLGDPLGDLALFLLYSTRSLPGITDDSDAGGLAPAAVDVPGHPSVAEIIDRYADPLRSRPCRDLRWYRAFAAFKLAAICQGVHHRYLHGGYGEQPQTSPTSVTWWTRSSPKRSPCSTRPRSCTDGVRVGRNHR